MSRLALIKAAALRREMDKPAEAPRLKRMRRDRHGMPDPSKCLPVVFVVKGAVVGSADDFYAALERLDNYPPRTEVIDAATFARTLAVRCKRDFLPMVHVEPAKEVAA